MITKHIEQTLFKKVVPKVIHHVHPVDHRDAEGLPDPREQLGNGRMDRQGRNEAEARARVQVPVDEGTERIAVRVASG